MNQVLSLVRTARASSDPVPVLYSDHMLAELLALHEEMIVQLRLERLEVVGSAQFLSAMIAQHENTAALLRAKLGNPAASAIDDGAIVITGEASSEAAKSDVTQFAQRARGAKSVRNNMTVKR